MSLQDHAAKATALAQSLDFEAAPYAPSRDLGGIKRAFDLGIAIPLFLLLAPALAAIALWIWLDSSGPVLFCQRRLGLNGRPFCIFKFRTMNVLEDGDNIVQACEGDTRVTGVGRFLRKTSLDELPQLINVIKGEMSLVGPRPHAIAHDKFYAMHIRDYQQRQLVKPGITGWAQVNGFHGATPTIEIMRRRVEHDVWYAHNHSFVLDLKILLRTARVVLQRQNAY